METMGQSSSSNPKSQLLQTYVSKSLEGFKDDDHTYELLLVARFASMKKLTTPALTIGLDITNSIDVNSSSSSISQLSLSQYEDIRASNPLSKQAHDLAGLINLQLREFPSSSIDPSEGNISETRSFSGMSETNVFMKHRNCSKISENNNYSRFDSNKPRGIVTGVKRKLADEKQESSTGTDCQKLMQYKSLLNHAENNNTAFV